MLQVVLEPTPPFMYAIKAFHFKVTTERVNGRFDKHIKGEVVKVVDTSLSIAKCAMESAGKGLTLKYDFRRCPNGSIRRNRFTFK